MTDDSFVFYRTFAEQLNEMPDDMRLKFYGYICAYGLDEKAPDVRGIEKALWIPIQYAIDKTKERRDQNRKNGAKGGRPSDTSGNDDKPEESSPAQSSLPEQPEVSEAKQTATDNIEGFEQKPEITIPAQLVTTEKLEATKVILPVTITKPEKTGNNPTKPTGNQNKPNKTEANPPVTDLKPTPNLNVYGNGNVNGSSSESQQVSKNNSTTTIFSLQVQEHLHKLCFDFDENAVSRITSVLVCFGYMQHLDYLDYCLDMLCKKKFPDKPFPDKPKPEQQTLFLTAVTTWQDWRSGFPKWQAEQTKAIKQKAAAQTKANPPAVCPDCGAALIRQNGLPVCTHCNLQWEFETGTQNEPAKWVKYKRPAVQDFSGIWKNIPKPAAQKQQAKEQPAMQFDIF
jgi:hypothetical protein